MVQRSLPPHRRLLGWAASLLLLMSGWLMVAPQPALADPAPSGARLFADHCAGCHVNGGNILRRSKTLKLAALKRQGIDSEAAIALIAANGIGQMDGYAAQLGPGGAEAVARWVWSQAQAGWPRR